MSGNKKSILKGFISRYKPYRRLLVLDMFCSAMIAVIALVFPLLIRYITEDVIEADLGNSLPLILQVSVVLLILITAQTGFSIFRDYKGHDMGAKIERDMRSELFAHLQKLSFSFYDNNKTGQLMSRLTTDLLNLAEFCHHIPENIVVYGTQFIGALIILFIINAKLALVASALLPVMAVYSFVFYRKLQKVYKESYESIGQVNAEAEESLTGIRITQSFANEIAQTEKFNIINNRFYKSRARIYKYEALHYSVMSDFFKQIITVAVIVAGGIWISNTSVGFSDLLVFILYMPYLMGPIPNLAFMVQQYQQGMTGYRRFCEIMETEPEIKDHENADEFRNVKGRIDFKNVAFAYSDDKNYVLNNINLSVKEGETVAVVGHSGVGKTTLCSLLPRFYEIKAGEILIDGINIRNVSIKSLRKNIGIVEQENFLFNGTVMENILFGKPDASEEEVTKAAKAADAHGFITALPKGYNTEIGQRGIKLSGGQKQRLAIARVFLKNPPILIFDEATSSLDYESEKAVMEGLLKLSKGRTSFFIAHRLSTVRNAGRIIVLSEDGIAEHGTHDELIILNGTYANLYKAQLI